MSTSTYPFTARATITIGGAVAQLLDVVLHEEAVSSAKEADYIFMVHSYVGTVNQATPYLKTRFEFKDTNKGNILQARDINIAFVTVSDTGYSCASNMVDFGEKKIIPRRTPRLAYLEVRGRGGGDGGRSQLSSMDIGLFESVTLHPPS